MSGDGITRDEHGNLVMDVQTYLDNFAHKQKAKPSKGRRGEDGKRKKDNLEQRIQKGIINYLKMSPLISWVRRHNSGKVQTAWGTWVVLGEPGDSDVFAMFSANAGDFAGKFLAIEVKKPEEEPTDDQWEFMNLVNADGGVAFPARSTDDVIREFTERGILS